MINKSNIVLIGLMGAGKTSIGRLLAHKTNYKFVDIYQIIEQRTGNPISKIFEEKGEDFFRKLEEETIAEFSKKTKLIISTGGGAPENPTNLKNLSKMGILIYLYASVDILFERLASEINNRPMLFAPNPKLKLKELLEKREPFYLKADIKIDTSKKTVEELADDILNLLKRGQKWIQ